LTPVRPGDQIREEKDEETMSLNLKDPKSVKDKLENLRKLFEEEDMNEAVKKIQKEWETEERSVD